MLDLSGAKSLSASVSGFCCPTPEGPIPNPCHILGDGKPINPQKCFLDRLAGAFDDQKDIRFGSGFARKGSLGVRRIVYKISALHGLPKGKLGFGIPQNFDLFKSFQPVGFGLFAA